MKKKNIAKVCLFVGIVFILLQINVGISLACEDDGECNSSLENIIVTNDHPNIDLAFYDVNGNVKTNFKVGEKMIIEVYLNNLDNVDTIVGEFMDFNEDYFKITSYSNGDFLDDNTASLNYDSNNMKFLINVDNTIEEQKDGIDIGTSTSIIRINAEVVAAEWGSDKDAKLSVSVGNMVPKQLIDNYILNINFDDVVEYCDNAVCEERCDEHSDCLDDEICGIDGECTVVLNKASLYSYMGLNEDAVPLQFIDPIVGMFKAIMDTTKGGNNQEPRLYVGVNYCDWGYKFNGVVCTEL